MNTYTEIAEKSKNISFLLKEEYNTLRCIKCLLFAISGTDPGVDARRIAAEFIRLWKLARTGLGGRVDGHLNLQYSILPG
jgi:hypothetical protein